MKCLRAKSAGRRGSAILLSAILLPVVLIMSGLSIDMAHIVVVKSQLQNAADSAALAGASALFQSQLSAIGSSVGSAEGPAITAARSKARQFSALNYADGVSVTIPASLDSDIVVGYQDLTIPGSPVQSQTTNFPNAVQVTVRRDGKANGSLSLYFGSLAGVPTWSGTATATASVQDPGNISSFKSVPGVNGDLFPVAIDVNYWKTLLLTGKAADGLQHDDFTVTFPAPNSEGIISTGTVTSGSDNIPEFNNAYGSTQSPGNFGLIDVGPDANDTPTFRTWIDSGPSSSDIQDLLTRNLLPATPSAPKQWKGGPGLKSTLVSNMAGVIGQPRLFPLFSSVSGNGSNTYYTIVGFAAATVVQATGDGSNISVTLQPTIVIDPTAVFTPTTRSSTVPPQYAYSPYHLSLTN